MDTQNALLLDIDVALEMHKFSATRFGYLAAGDPGVLAKLRKGRRARPALLAKMAAALDLLERGEL